MPAASPARSIRLGDVRKNYAIYWPYASRAPYGGVASIGGDPRHRRNGRRYGHDR